MKPKTYTKKILIENELSTPEARAERLKRVRNLANLTRKDICDTGDMNINTYKGWELARFGGLPVDGAGKIVNRVAKEGVICSAEWLLYGESPAPSLSYETVCLKNEAYSGDTLKLSLIEREFSVYRDEFENAVLEEVKDDSLLPQIKKGDFLAGIKKYGEEINLLVNQLCIIQTTDGKKLIRYVKQGCVKGHYSLICPNPLSYAEDLVVVEVRLLYAAAISRHYIVYPTTNQPT